MIANAIRVVCLGILFIAVPVVFVTTFYRREARIPGDHERVPTGTWIALFAGSLAWTVIWVGLAAWAYQAYGAYQALA